MLIEFINQIWLYVKLPGKFTFRLFELTKHVNTYPLSFLYF
ncbi:hypothetical protein F383_27966 [Gossypium arboreum]|uniref:Uncharacterized protein n=1 Tax=Gossypium arboreum TaxID=29729 RepID=A0A0B0PDP5_GOSAR|nr:hypothetical protein F383_27966 [Gossypium arboreum]